MAKGRAYDNLYARLEAKEREKELYKLARQRYRAGKDVQHVRVIKDKNGNVMVNSEAVLKRWKEYFEKLMNEENNRDPRTEEAEVVNDEVNCVSREIKNALRRIKKGKDAGPDELPIEVWKCMEKLWINFLTRLFNRLFYFYFYFYHYIYPPDSQESDEGAIHRVSNYSDLLPEIPRYCCPLVIW